MVQGLRAGWRGLRHLFAQSHVYIWTNVLWFLLTIGIITAPLAWAGLCRMSYMALRQPSARLDDFKEGFKAHWKGGLLLGVIGLLFVIINMVNLMGYSRSINLQTSILRVIWLMALVGWFGIQLFAFPLLNAMEKPTLMGAYRNAAVMVFLNPLFSLSVGIVALLVVIISAIIPVALVLITGAALASIGNAAVQNRLIKAGIQEDTAPPEPEPGAVFDEIYL